jgi:CRP-like cAMP-binding protein
LFADVGSSDCDTIISSAREKRFARRETIFSEGDPVRYVIMLISGLAKVTRPVPTAMKLFCG